MSALVTAIREKRFRQVKLLIDIGVDVNARHSASRETALMELCRLEQEAKAARLTKLLLDQGAKIGLKDASGMTALSHACRLGREQLVSQMIDEAHDFDLNSADNNGNTALHFAALSGNFAVLNLMIRALKKFKLSVDKVNKKGETALICASKSGNFFLARILISEGKASKGARDNVAFKTADEWGKTKDSLRSASKSPLFRMIQPQLVALSPASETTQESQESLVESNGTRRPHTAPELSAKSVGNHRQAMRKVFSLLEVHVSSAYRPGVKPKPVVIRENSPTQSEQPSVDSECPDDVCELNSRANSPGTCSLNRRFSVGRAAAKFTGSTFRRRSIATMSMATAGSKLGDLTRRGTQLTLGAGRRPSSQNLNAPKLRRGSMNVISKVQLAVKTKSRKDAGSGEKTSGNSNLQPAAQKAPPRFSPQLMARLQTLAEASDSDEDDEDREEPLQRSSPAQLFSR